MADSGTYGHFGQAVYDRDRKKWRFDRSKSTGNTKQLLGEPKLVVRPSAPPDFLWSDNVGKEGSSRRREKQVKSLVQRNPELQPASRLLPDLACVSEAVEEATGGHDSSQGNLLSFGTITHEGTKRKVNVVAFPSGPTGSDLRVVQVRKQRRGWPDSRDVWLEVPTMSGEEAIWKGPGVPIKSIVFARPDDRGGSFLAVRLMMQTRIFQPILRKVPLLGQSRLDLNPLLDLDIGETGGYPQADIVFNPWNTRQLAVVDQTGRSSVWELGGRKTDVVKRVCPIAYKDDNVFSTTTPLDDAWARIAWICSPSNVIVCTRRSLRLLEICREELLQLQEIRFDLDKAGAWILDMIVVPSQLELVCVLTSIHILVYHVDPNNDNVLRNVIKVRHFRNQDDISLRLHIFDDQSCKTLRKLYMSVILSLMSCSGYAIGPLWYYIFRNTTSD